MSNLGSELRAIRAAIDGLRDAIQKHAKTIHTAEEPKQDSNIVRKRVPVLISLDEETKKDAKKDSSQHYRIQKSIRNWAACAAIFAVIYAGIAAWQAREMQREFREDQRPIVSIEKIATVDIIAGTFSDPVIGKPLGVSIVFKNTGKSSALDLDVQRHVLFGSYLRSVPVKQEPVGSGEPHGSILEPGVENTMTAVSVKDTYKDNSVFVNESVEINWEGSTDIAIFGRIAYKDRFETEYCLPFAKRRLTSGAWQELESINGTDINSLCSVGNP